MNDNSVDPLDEFSDEQLKSIDKIRDQFEMEYRAGQTPKIEQFIEKCEPDLREELFKDLIAIELELCEPGQRKELAADLKMRFPDDQKAIDGLLVDLESTANIKSSLPERNQKAHVGNYKLLQQIGEGGMGSVWMAEQEKPVRRRVAIKLIRSDIGSNEAIARFEAERQALAMMDHQNIAKVLDAGTTDDGSPYFVMELVKGIPITNFCDDNKLSIRERLELFIPVCNAVQHAHQKGIIHRDLKPSNVLVTLYDGKPVPKVIDFGLAKALEHTTKLTDKTMFTEFGKIVGTVQYMSPEQAEMNALDVDTRTDIYSLGVMLYELLTGSTPLDKETLGKNAILQILAIIREKEPPRPSHRLSSSKNTAKGISEHRKINPGKLQQILRGELDWVVMKALDKDRRRRYETANDLAHDIEHFLVNEPVKAKPPSTIYRLQKLALRHKVLIAAISTTIVLLLIGVAITTWFAFAADDARQIAELASEQKDVALKLAQKKGDEAEQRFKLALNSIRSFYEAEHNQELFHRRPELRDLAVSNLNNAAKFLKELDSLVDYTDELGSWRIVKELNVLLYYTFEIGEFELSRELILIAIDRCNTLHKFDPSKNQYAEMLFDLFCDLADTYTEESDFESAEKHYQLAIKGYEKLLTNYPELNRRYLQDLADIYHDFGRSQPKGPTQSFCFEKSISYCAMILKLEPNDIYAKDGMAAVYLQLGWEIFDSEPDKAIQHFEKALKLALDNYLRTFAINDKKMKEIARDRYASCLGSNAAKHAYKGEFEDAKHSHELAMKIYDKFVEDSNNSYPYKRARSYFKILLAKALIKSELHENDSWAHDLAKTACDESREIEDMSLYHNLHVFAKILVRKSQFNEALKLQTEALRIMPTSTSKKIKGEHEALLQHIVSKIESLQQSD